MSELRDYEQVNKANWDERAPVHAESVDYNLSDFIKNKDHVGDVVSFDRPRLPDLTGKKVVHLQCHIGTDTLGLARLGAASVTGLDFSGTAIAEARKLAEATLGSGGEKLTYVEASVYDAANVLEAGTFDVVFTGIGALCWIHSIEEWAAVVSKLLKPGGRLFIREGHPVLWALDETDKEKLSIKFPYFERKEPTVWEFENTYVQTDHVFKTNKTNEFNHGIGEIVQAVINSGMRLTNLEEHQSVPWNALPELMTEQQKNEWTVTNEPWRLPHSYTLQAVKEEPSK